MYLPGFFSLALILASAAAAATPVVGKKAPDFQLRSVTGDTVRLSDFAEKSAVVLVVLRGYPGYQCPLCQRQVRDFISKAQGFTDAGVRVLLVYPGAAETAGAKAKEFVADQVLPEPLHLLLDPDYLFTDSYGLRWAAKGETAYPSTFLIDRTGAIYFSKIAKSHAGRTTAAEVLDLLPKKKTRD